MVITSRTLPSRRRVWTLSTSSMSRGFYRKTTSTVVTGDQGGLAGNPWMIWRKQGRKSPQRIIFRTTAKGIHQP